MGVAFPSHFLLNFGLSKAEMEEEVFEVAILLRIIFEDLGEVV